MTPEQLATAEELRRKGLTYRKIADELGVSQSMVRRKLDPAAYTYDKVRQEASREAKVRHVPAKVVRAEWGIAQSLAVSRLSLSN